MYHRVDLRLSARDPITLHLTVMAPAFETQLRLLRDAGDRSMMLDALRAAIDRRAPLPGRRVVLTFDDGYEDNYTVVFPLLRRYGFIGTFFVVTSTIGTRDHLTAPQLREMAEAGMEIESHGVHHVDFSLLSPAAARSELARSRKTIEAWTGRPVAYFAYPAGRYNAGLERILEDLGYRGAVTERPGSDRPRRHRRVLRPQAGAPAPVAPRRGPGRLAGWIIIVGMLAIEGSSKRGVLPAGAPNRSGANGKQRLEQR